MKRTSFWLFVTVLTFALGVAAVFGWFNFQRSPAKTVQLDSTAESKNHIAPENPKKIDLERNRRLWQESKTDNYDFVCTRFGGGIYGWVPVLVKVRNRQFISKEPARRNAGLERTDGYEDFVTVEKMFNKIKEAIDEGFLSEVRYNKEFGYPEYTNIDDMKTMHSGFTIEISKFENVTADFDNVKRVN